MAYEQVLTALADPTRRAVLESLRSGPQAVTAIATRLPVSRPAVSQHLAVLREAGLVEAETRGTARLYRLRAEGLAELKRWLEGMWDDALLRLKQESERDDG